MGREIKSEYVIRRPLQSLDEACAELREIAKRLGLDRIDVGVRADGRIDVEATNGNGYTAWIVHGDVLAGGGLPRPADALRAKLNDPESPDGSSHHGGDPR